MGCIRADLVAESEVNHLFAHSRSVEDSGPPRQFLVLPGRQNKKLKPLKDSSLLSSGSAPCYGKAVFSDASTHRFNGEFSHNSIVDVIDIILLK